MKILKLSNFRIYLRLPSIRKYHEGAFARGRTGFKLSFDTGFLYLEADEDSGSWFELTLLGFGLGFYWNFKNKEWWWEN